MIVVAEGEKNGIGVFMPLTVQLLNLHAMAFATAVTDAVSSQAFIHFHLVIQYAAVNDLSHVKNG